MDGGVIVFLLFLPLFLLLLLLLLFSIFVADDDYYTMKNSQSQELEEKHGVWCTCHGCDSVPTLPICGITEESLSFPVQKHHEEGGKSGRSFPPLERFPVICNLTLKRQRERERAREREEESVCVCVKTRPLLGHFFPSFYVDCLLLSFLLLCFFFFFFFLCFSTSLISQDRIV